MALAPKSPQKLQRELEDLQLVLKARNGSKTALDELMRRYHGFVRLKASWYFLAGGDSDDLIQEGLIGLYKAIRDPLPTRRRRSGHSRSSASPVRSSPRSSRRRGTSTRR